MKQLIATALAVLTAAALAAPAAFGHDAQVSVRAKASADAQVSAPERSCASADEVGGHMHYAYGSHVSTSYTTGEQATDSDGDPKTDKKGDPVLASFVTHYWDCRDERIATASAAPDLREIRTGFLVGDGTRDNRLREPVGSERGTYYRCDTNYGGPGYDGVIGRRCTASANGVIDRQLDPAFAMKVWDELGRLA